MTDKIDDAIRKAETNWGGMTKNDKFEFDRACKEHSHRGEQARRIRDGKK